MACSQCGAEILPDDKFCGKCGYNIGKPKKAPAIDYSEPQSYTPKFIADKILTARSSIEGERKLVTVLFADVMEKDLKSYLQNLQGLEFIYEKRLFPELEYIFKHALTQEVAYNSLLLKRRKEIHAKIGRAIEQIYPDKLEEFCEMLGPRTSNLFEIESQTRVNLGENYLMKGELQQAREYFEIVYQNVRKPEYFFARWRWMPRCLLKRKDNKHE